MMVKESISKNLSRAGGAARRRASELLQKPSVITACECAVRFSLTLILSRARIFGAYAPFGVSMLAASGAGLGGASALAGAVIGYLVMGGLGWGLKYLAMCVLAFSACFVFRETSVYKRPFFAPLCAGLMAAISGFVYMSDAGFTLTSVVFYITETVLVGGCTLFYSSALSPWNEADAESELKHTVGFLILGATALIALSRIYLVNIISVGRALAVVAVMLSARKSGAGGGAAAGVALGFAMDASLGRSPFFCMIYGFSGLVSGVFSKQKRLLFTLSYLMSNLVSTLWAWDGALRSGSLYEVFIASVIFMVLPSPLLVARRVRSAGAAETGMASLRLYSAERISQISRAFGELYESLRSARRQEPNDNDISKVFFRAAALVCRKCRRGHECWSDGFDSTMSAMNDATRSMTENGELSVSDLPEHFTAACLKPEAFVGAVNDSLRASLYRRQCAARVRESQGAAISQYREVADILSAAAGELSSDQSAEAELETRLLRYLRGSGSDASVSVWRDAGGRLRAEISGALSELRAQPDHLDRLSAVLGARLCERSGAPGGRMALMEAEPLAASVGVASMRRSGQAVCGDSESFFKTDSGELCVILSDGMGSGEGAARLSSEAVSILERFIKAGVEPDGALRILSSVMVLRGDENGCATADILLADLFSGRARSYKCGAAPTYLRAPGGGIRRLCCSSAAVGLTGSAPERSSAELPAGSLAVMVSDGVLEGEDDRWLRDKLSAFSGTDVKVLAGSILSAAMDAHGGEDDMTVLCLLLSERE